MSTISGENWVDLNQKYLTTAINCVKARLLMYQNTLSGNSGTEDFNQQLESAEKELRILENDMSAKPALQQLSDLFTLGSFEKKMLLLCAGVELDAQLANLVQVLQGGSFKLPTFSLALSAFEDAHWSAFSPEAPLRYWRLIDLSGHELLTHSPCAVDEQILHYLTGIRYMTPRLKQVLTPVQPDAQVVSAHRETADAIVRHCSRFNNLGIQLRGCSAEDKMALAAGALEPYQLMVYQLNPALLPGQLQELVDFSRLWNRSAALHNIALFIDGARWEDLDPLQKRHTVYFLENVEGIVILGMDQKISGLLRPLAALDIKPLTTEEQYTVWQNHLGPLAKTLDGELGAITAQFNLHTSAIKKLSGLVAEDSTLATAKKRGGADIRKQLWKVCVEHTRPDLDSLAQRIEPVATLDDLVLPEMEKAILKEISIHVQQRRKVYEEWGFARKGKRGLGISALFSGESGTGKTMASEVLANELQLDLYRIDLSQVVNKYIGETEKNLKKVFDAAEGSGAILLFDEADALFGKRSEVKDSHDRYSNIEVSYLLQKMEEYRGLAILTTNMRNALDRAFLRRLSFVVQFPFPDANRRAEIWKKVFPSQTPTIGLDFQKLAALNIAGGNIRNIALNASFTAAGHNRPVSMADIQQAARNEYLKLEKHMSTSESLI